MSEVDVIVAMLEMEDTESDVGIETEDGDGVNLNKRS